MKRMTDARFRVAYALLAVGAVLVAIAQDANVARHMRHHHDALLQIQGALIDGLLLHARQPARWLMEHQPPAGLTAGTEAYVDAMRTAARELLDAPDVVSAARATSRLGLACGDCHIANNVAVEFEAVELPPGGNNAKAHMQRHQWATDRILEGLVGPSSLSWSRGIDLLSESPLNPEALGAKPGDDALLGASRRIHQLALNAKAVSELIERAGIYAELLVNCAACHTNCLACHNVQIS